MDTTTHPDTTTLDLLDRLDRGIGWTAARIAAVPADRLDAPTPCRDWDLEQLLDHTIGSLTMLTDALADGAGTPDDEPAPPALGPSRWDRSIADLAHRNRRAWQAPGVMDRSVELPIGTQPAPVLASITLLEAVTHGWDISQASGEAAAIPDDLAVAILEFARQALPDDRGDDFAADLGTGDTPADRLVAFLGRTPA
jgi:uncharacterized protein (TIGR03086 family)